MFIECKNGPGSDCLWGTTLGFPCHLVGMATNGYFPPARTNIPGNRVAEGQETCPYLPPFPARGSGFHRCAFLLFKQDKPINFSEDTRPSPW